MIPNTAAFEKFLEERLELPRWKTIWAESKLKLVEEIVFAFGRHIYLQNISWSCRPLGKRKLPDREEALKVVLEEGQTGGCCIHNNYVLQILLRHFLGLNAYLVAVANPVYPHLPHSHVIVILHITPDDLDLTSGQGQGHRMSQDIGIYAIDVGFSRPIPHVIPLHKLPFHGKTGGWSFEVKYNVGTGKYERILYGGCPGFGKLKDSENGRRLDYTFDLVPHPFEYFDAAMSQIFVDPSSKFLKTNFIIRMTRIENSEDYNYVICLRKAIVEGSRDEFKQTVYKTHVEMEPHIQKLFPRLNKEELEAALRKFDEYEIEQSAQN